MVDIRKLPNPTTDAWEWQTRGACRDLDSAMFFHPDSTRGPTRTAREARARAICATCPVITDCRLHALSVQEPYGVWGGLTEADRTALRHTRPTAEPSPTAPNPAETAAVEQPIKPRRPTVAFRASAESVDHLDGLDLRDVLELDLLELGGQQLLERAHDEAALFVDECFPWDGVGNEPAVRVSAFSAVLWQAADIARGGRPAG